MSKVQKLLIREYAVAAVEQCTKAAIKYLVSSKHMLSGDDSGLNNTWEEICVQVQGEKSYFWAGYESLIQDAVAGALLSLEARDRQAIWLQTDGGWDWHWEVENGDNGDDQLIPANDEEIVAYIADRVRQAALDFTNDRICRFLCPENDWLDDECGIAVEGVDEIAENTNAAQEDVATDPGIRR